MDMKVRPVLFDISMFVLHFSRENKPVSWVLEKRDKNSALLTEIDFAEVEFITCRKEREGLIAGGEQFSRLKETGCTLFGGSVFMGLWKDYQARGKNSILERLYQEKEIISIDFFGDVGLTEGGEFVFWLRRFPFNNTWGWLYGWMGANCLEDRLSAVSSQI